MICTDICTLCRYTILEKSHQLGGTWYDNTYPGVACDVPSHLYSYSFFQVATGIAHARVFVRYRYLSSDTGTWYHQAMVCSVIYPAIYTAEGMFEPKRSFPRAMAQNWENCTGILCCERSSKDFQLCRYRYRFYDCRYGTAHCTGTFSLQNIPLRM
jgi:hypothetical protein